MVLSSTLDTLVAVLVQVGEVFPQLPVFVRYLGWLNSCKLVDQRLQRGTVEFVLVRLQQVLASHTLRKKRDRLFPTFRLPRWVNFLLQLSNLHEKGFAFECDIR